MDQNPRDAGTSWRARPCASARRAIGASMLACALAGMLSAAAPSAAARTMQVPAVADDHANTCKQASGDVAIAACTRAIASGRYAGHDLAKLHYDRAVEYANKGDYDSAITDLSRGIRLDPENPSSAFAYKCRGLVYIEKNDFDRAIADFSEAIRLAPNYAEAYYNRAHAYRAKKDNDRAIADYSETIRLEPRAANVWYDRANAYLDKDNYDRAIADYTEALRLNPNDTAALVNRGIAYRDKGQYDQAIEDHDRAIRLDLHPPATDYVDPLDHSISMST